MAGPEYTCEVDTCNKVAERRGYCTSHYKRLMRHGDPLGGSSFRASRGDPAAFIAAALEMHTDECIIWPFAKDKDGYGKVGRSGRAHRQVLELAEGPAPSPEHEAAHKPQVCHNPSCINPRHLRWATIRENSHDRFLDGTDCCGEKGGNTKLTEQQVAEIRSAFAAGERVSHIAVRFAVTTPNVRNIVLGKTWVGRRNNASAIGSA